MSDTPEELPDFPFSLRHFFEGALCREEVVSACLAMLLEGSAAFRSHFFSLIGDEQLMLFSGQNWKLEVEKNEVDIHLTHRNTIILVENKIDGSALQQGQLVRYYRQQLIECPQARIVSVLLAPGRIGQSEVELTRQAAASRGEHFVSHISWEDVLTLPDSFTDANRPWILGILSFVTEAISKKREQRYDFVEDRGVLSDLINDLLRRIQSNSKVRVKPDKRQRTQEVYSIKNSCTMAVGFGFDCDAESDYVVSGITQADGRLQVKIRSYIRLSKAGEGLAIAVENWRQLSKATIIPIPGVGEFVMQPDFSFLWEELTTASREEVLVRMLEVWSCVEQFALERGILHDID